MEDFGQIMDVPAGQRQYSRSYEELARVYAYLCPNEIEKLLKRLAFMLVSGNGDAHLKNWSLIYPDRRSPSLAPAYDLISTICRIRNETLALSLNGQRDFYGVDRRAFEGLAQALGLGAEALGLKMQRWAQFYAEIWVQYRRELGFSESEQGKIDAHLKKLPLLAPALASGAKGVP